MKTELAVVLLILIISLISLPAMAQPGLSYTYNYWREMVPAPHAYVPQTAINGLDLQVGALRSPQDIYVWKDTYIFILDTGNNRIIQVDSGWDLIQIISDFENDGAKDGFDNPTGLHVSAHGDIYVADRGNGRVVILNLAGELQGIITSPVKQGVTLFSTDFRFRPEKISSDGMGTIYVIAASVYDGILEFDTSGNFLGFKGAPRVLPSLLDYLWRQIGTRAQRERMALFLPVEHSNLAVDARGFVYATAVGGALDEAERIRRLNTAGRDILQKNPVLPAIGDFVDLESPSSTFVDILPGHYDTYSVLDYVRGRVFTYDATGNLLYVFGGLGEELGTFRNPVAIANIHGNMLVLDALKNSVTVYQPTEYQQIIFQALGHYYNGDFPSSAEAWERVLELNSNYDLAYTGTGNALLMQGRYQEAMEAFRLANNREAYSQAFGYYRREVLGSRFTIVALVVLSLFVGVWWICRPGGNVNVVAAKAQQAATYHNVQMWEDQRNRGIITNLKRIGYGLGFSLKLIFSPIEGFWDLKYEKRGNLPAAATILGLVVLTYVFMRQYTGFLLNPRNLKELNIVLEVFSIVFPFLLWAGINWSLTTLMDGKGSITDIIIASAFALTPLVLVNIPATIVSNFITLQEGAFYYFFLYLSILWCCGLLFFGTMVTHEYTFGQTVFVTLLILAGIGIALFIGLLFADIVLQLFAFFGEVYHELVFRL